MTVGAFIVAWFLAHGYAAHQARALDHVAFVESGHDYCIIADAGYRGAFQWDESRWFSHFGDRCPPLEKQLALADRELRQNFRCFFRARTEGEAYRVFRATFAAGRPC